MKKFRKLVIVAIIVLLILLAGLMAFDSSKIVVNEHKGNASIAVTGDVMFARNMEGILSSGENPFVNVVNVTSKTDLLLINFENAATTSENAVKGDVPLKTSPSFVYLARNNPNTIASLANNHAFDYGIDGMHDTIKNLEKNNITPIGAGDNVDEAHKGVTKEINGRNITIFNFMDSENFAEYSNEVMPVATSDSPGYSAYNSSVCKDIKEAHENSDCVIVFFHYGNEYSTSPNENQVKMSHEVIDAGADLVLGSHPHVPQGLEFYNGSMIFYSLGNFIFDQKNPDTHVAYFVEINLVNETVECTVHPICIVNYLPQFMSPDNGKSLLESLSPSCDKLIIEDDGTGRVSYNLTD